MFPLISATHYKQYLNMKIERDNSPVMRDFKYSLLEMSISFSVSRVETVSKKTTIFLASISFCELHRVPMQAA